MRLKCQQNIMKMADCNMRNEIECNLIECVCNEFVQTFIM